MVEALPADGAVVVVYTTGMLHYLQKMLRDFRGRAFASQCDVIIVRNRNDIHRLLDFHRPIFVDHAVYEDGLSPGLQAVLSNVVERANLIVGGPAP
jgi:molybdopterin-guanine dinucleotide biosynthesis protein A